MDKYGVLLLSLTKKNGVRKRLDGSPSGQNRKKVKARVGVDLNNYAITMEACEAVAAARGVELHKRIHHS